MHLVSLFSNEPEMRNLVLNPSTGDYFGLTSKTVRIEFKYVRELTLRGTYSPENIAELPSKHWSQYWLIKSVASKPA